MNKKQHIEELIVKYLNEQAHVFFLVLTKNGAIEEANLFTKNILGPELMTQRFQEIIVDFRQDFDLSSITKETECSKQLTVRTKNGQPQTYQFCFQQLDDNFIVFGHINIEEIEVLSNELIIANRELNNLTRQLNVTNRALKLANEKVLELSRIDPLTQLANRRYFDEIISKMVSLAKRKNQTLSLIMTDIDHFKAVNDNFGHDAGDHVLKGYAAIMKESSRKEDFITRFGGEEFTLLLPVTDSQQAYILAERIRLKLSKKDILGNKYSVTASFGISQLRKEEAIEDFIKRADEALYKAKNEGRNKTIISY